jgi:hypothetical protein
MGNARILSVLLTSWMAWGCTSDGDLCNETAAQLFSRDQRCRVVATSTATYRDVLGCGSTRVRDRAALTEVCWPALAASECTAIPYLPEACRDQF